MSRPLAHLVSSSRVTVLVSGQTLRLSWAHTYQLVEHTLVQPPLLRPAVPELLVVVLEALPMATELVKALLVDVADAADCQQLF